jgi:hypothetical protein
MSKFYFLRTASEVVEGAPLVPGSGRRNRSKHGRPPAPAEEHAEPRSAASSVGTERRARTTAVAILASAQNGTYVCALECVSLATSNPKF